MLQPFILSQRNLCRLGVMEYPEFFKSCWLEVPVIMRPRTPNPIVVTHYSEMPSDKWSSCPIPEKTWIHPVVIS